jgi:ribosomal protein S18 acetylase RimI-like enzyme|tara:strand:+ start:44337 stop:44861 length:525 start_codon:yes stop_codon:yes gene_type:complete
MRLKMELDITDNIYVRPLLPVDVPNIMRLETEEFYFPINGHPWSKETLAEMMNHQHTGGLAVEYIPDGLKAHKQFCGFLIYTFEEGCAIIQRIITCPQGKGIGFFLMNSFEANLPRKSDFEILVAVKETDERSQDAFYAWGFEEGEEIEPEEYNPEDLGTYISFSKEIKEEHYL